MADLIVIRIHPVSPTTGAAFRSSLAGLTITVFDRSYRNATSGTSIGEVSFNTPDTSKGAIVVHVTRPPILPGDPPPNIPFAIATAAIVINRPAGFTTEYQTADLTLKIARNGIPIADHSINYNIGERMGVSLPLPNAPAPGDSPIVAASKAVFYMSLTPVSLHWAMPVFDTDPNKAYLDVPTDGTPPNFDALRRAIEKVLASDPTGTVDMTNLTIEQSRNIAYEIVWNRTLLPVPVPPNNDSLEQLYTKTASDSDANTKDRNRFESDLTNYYVTNNSRGDLLTKFVYGLSAALASQARSVNANQVGFAFPVLLSGASTPGKIAEARVGLSRPVSPGSLLGFDVPAPYFYALAATLPPDVGPDLRYRVATMSDGKQIVTTLQKAIDSGVISANSPTVLTTAPSPAMPTGTPISIEQAARRLRALGAAAGVLPICVPGLAATLVSHWLAYNSNNTGDPEADLAGFWAGNPTALTAQDLADHRDLVLCAITKLSAPNQPPDAIVSAIQGAGLPIASTKDLAAIKTDDWTKIFTANLDLLVDVTGPGSISQRVARFIRRLTNFFNVAPAAAPGLTLTQGGPPQLDRSNSDPIAAFVSAFTAGFKFGQTPSLDATAPAFKSAVVQVFPNDRGAQAWLAQTLLTIDALYRVSNVSGVDDATRFSIAEALYARGFTDAASIAALSQHDFADAVIGTVAYVYARDIQTNAGGSASGTSTGNGGFVPINSDGSLSSCIPPPQRSPLGPLAYLHGLLSLSTAASCDNPEPSTEPEMEAPPTLGALLQDRRGPLGELAVTQANLETPLPVIDLVNECLEAMAGIPSSHGAVYDTATDQLGEHRLRQAGDPAGELAHDPITLFDALPQHSSPATPVEQPKAYAALASDFSACSLPYSQPLDVNRSYLHALHTTRFSAMHHLRKEISVFVLDPAREPAAFPAHRWRYPLRIELAREYLGISPEEHSLLYTASLSTAQVQALYGFPIDTQDWLGTVVRVSEFLTRMCLSYCEFRELWSSQFVPFSRRRTNQQGDTEFPLCPPCLLDQEQIVFGAEQDTVDALRRLAIFIRLWRTLQRLPAARYSFATLRDICDVLRLFAPDGNINPDFIRQLAAFQLLRDDLQLELADPEGPSSGIDAARTHILSLWVGPAAPKWSWALGRLLYRIEQHARRHDGPPRGSEFHKLLLDNFSALSTLAGFDPATPENTWSAAPTHTLRFSEVLVKIYASRFTVGELLFVLTADEHLDGDDPCRLPTQEESLDLPLGLPDDEPEFSLWKLRHTLLHLQLTEEEVETWSWPRIQTALRDEFGCAPPTGGADPLTSLGDHFFPQLLEHYGHTADAKRRQYGVPLASTTAAMWNTPPDGPFHYDSAAKELYAELPLRDDAVLNKLSRIRPLSNDEQQAVRDLYFLPRIELARFAFLFANFAEAEERLIQERDERERWSYFRRQFALCYKRSRAIACHLATHVGSATGTQDDQGDQVAWQLLRSLLADENRATSPWEDDSGKRPTVRAAAPGGGAFAALLGLLGTGLQGDFQVDGGLVWRELRGPMDAFGVIGNEWNAPVPTVIPSLGATLTAEQLRFEGVRNGIGLANHSAERLGGVQSFCVTWRGVLLIDEAGTYRFWGGSPTPGSEKPAVEATRNRRWRVLLRRGQRSWELLSHEGADQDCTPASSSPLSLKRGAYELTIEFAQCPASTDDLEDARPQRTGFQLKYEGPDTHNQIASIPFQRLFIMKKDGPLSRQLYESLSGAALQFLETLYVSSLRDVRRTYQRAFKAMLWARRFGLSAQVFHDYAQSELGYLLDHPDNFAGVSFYMSAGVWTAHRAGFDFNFLPLLDNYLPPPEADDDRVAPSTQRKQALFDIWERLFDYTILRRQARHAPERPVWLLFDEAAENQPDNAAQLLRHIALDLSHAALVLTYYRGYAVTAADLMDERWTIRVWRADAWLRQVGKYFLFNDLRAARPDLWVSDDPSVPEAGESESGNQNLTRVVQDGLIEQGPPRRYADLKRLNDGLRERARQALLAYLCRMNRVQLPDGSFATRPKQLSERLLLDVEAGLCEHASRTEEAISAVQSFVQRARLGLEPGFVPTPEFIVLWERRFQSFRVWQACVRRTLYRENWIEWDELEAARKTEAFRFLESELRRASLTLPRPGGLEHWDAGAAPAHPRLTRLQSREPATLKQITPPPRPAYDEALNLLGTPARSARRSWLAPTSMGDGQGDNDPTTPGGPPNGHDGREGGEGRDGREIREGRVGDERGRLSAAVVRRLASAAPAGGNAPGGLPLWIEAAIRLGTRFVRVAAAGTPPASTQFAPRVRGTGCCQRCGREHEPTVDEFYFWLVDSRWYDKLEGNTPNEPDSQDAEAPGWHDASRLPMLLNMTAKPMVHLMWARLHNGELEAPRRSSEGVRLKEETTPSTLVLQFAGRNLDSLNFLVKSLTDPPGTSSALDLGFRYDLATDAAIVLPQVVASPPPVPIWGGLPAYPYFGYFAPGAPLFPLSPYSEATLVASTLRTHCRFEAALKWYALAFDPLQNDLSWRPQVRQQPNIRPLARRSNLVGNDATEVSDDVARTRALTLNYLETLLEWSDCLRQRNAPEAFQQARLLVDAAAKLLGPTPQLIAGKADGTSVPKVSTFTPAPAPLNPRLLSLYERASDDLALLHTCNNIHRLRNGRLDRDMPFFGSDPARDGWRTATDVCAEDCACCCPPSPYRFTFLIEKAKQLASDTRELGAALLSAYEKGDAEYLAYVRAEQEKQLQQLSLEIKQNQLRDADWQVQALQKTKEITQTNLNYFQDLIRNGLNPGETDYQDLTNGAIGSRTAATVLDSICEVLNFIPDIHVGTVDFVDLPIGTKLSRVFETGARISNEVAEILSITAGLRLTQGGWDRREQEWRHQVDDLTIELEQIERQILGAERRRAAALRELNNQRRQIEQSREVLDLLRDKFTNHQLYLYLQKETAALYYQTYELALCGARQAQRAFNYERGHTTRRFVSADAWDSLREGLLAGERLQLGLRRMEKAYCDENVREYELTKHVSLALHFGRELLKLRQTGSCEIELPEWLFDLDYPGQYLRRIKNVSLSIPAVTGPYTGVRCRLTLLSSRTRVDPRLHGPVTPCCKKEAPRPVPAARCGCAPAPRPLPARPRPEPVSNGYVQVPGDPRIVEQYAATEAIATSTGQNDAGLFELNFRDERYLPFEFAGAVSRWRLELPPENNFFDLNTLSDVILHLNYTAREGGDVLRQAATEIAQQHLPNDGVSFFDLPRQFSGAWQKLQEQQEHERSHRSFELQLERRHFPFLPGDRELWIKRLELFIETENAQPSIHHEIEFVLKHKSECKYAEADEHEFQCIGSAQWPAFLHGVLDLPLGPLRVEHPVVGRFRFPSGVGAIRRAFLICHYEA